MGKLDLHQWRKGNEITAVRLDEIRHAIMSVLTGGRNIVVKMLGNRVIIENTQQLILPEGHPFVWIKLEDGPTDYVYTGVKQDRKSDGTFINSLDTTSYNVKFAGFEENAHLPSAADGDRIHDLVVCARYDALDDAVPPVPIYTAPNFLCGILALIADPT